MYRYRVQSFLLNTWVEGINVLSLWILWNSVIGCPRNAAQECYRETHKNNNCPANRLTTPKFFKEVNIFSN